MSPNQTKITRDLVNKKMVIHRKFNASVSLVWRAWTDPELLDQWWAPSPYKTVTERMNFTNGGQWLYYMLGPEGDKHWCLADYLIIDPEHYYTAKDAFCDENGVIDTSHPRMEWRNTFIAQEEHTLVSIEVSFENVEDLEKIIEMGFREGFTMAHGNLDKLLENKSYS
jgi:PhnB protein